MFLEVVGPKGGKLASSLVQSVERAVASFTRQLDIHRLSINLTVRVHHSDVIDDYAEGYCECVNPRQFIIDVCLYCNWMGILAHELVHVKQYARNQLSMDGRRWKSKRIGEDVEYYDLPWEKEAFRLQQKLVEEYEKRPI